MQGIGAFHGDDAVVGAEFPVQRAVAGVDGIDEFRPALQQAVGEAPDIAAEVGADETGDLEDELIECMFELEPGA